jgi:hypothetical protein
MPRRLVESLQRIAWDEERRGHHCCAQQAWQMALRLREAVDAAEKMDTTEGTACARPAHLQ